jgi:hypothetical protein
MEDSSPLEVPPIPEKPKSFSFAVVVILGILVVAAVSVYSWYAVYGPCSRRVVKSTSIALIDQANAFEAAYQSASSATPIGLIGAVTHMEQTLWDTREVAVPACMQGARNELTISMESAIRAYLGIMTQEREEKMKKLMADSESHLENFVSELETVNRCAPFCL